MSDELRDEVRRLLDEVGPEDLTQAELEKAITILRGAR